MRLFFHEKFSVHNTEQNKKTDYNFQLYLKLRTYEFAYNSAKTRKWKKKCLTLLQNLEQIVNFPARTKHKHTYSPHS